MKIQKKYSKNERRAAHRRIQFGTTTTTINRERIIILLDTWEENLKHSVIISNTIVSLNNFKIHFISIGKSKIVKWKLGRI